MKTIKLVRRTNPADGNQKETSFLTKTLCISHVRWLPLLRGVGVCFFILVGLAGASAQNIGINATGSTPNISAGLDVDFNNKGLLVPRLTTVERDAIASPAYSLLIFNTTTGCFEAYDTPSTSWVAFGCIGCIVPTGVTATPSPNPICAGNTLTLTGTATGATSWAWTGPNSFTSTLQSPTIAGITTAGAGVYSLTATNACGSATAVNTASVAVDSSPIITVQPVNQSATVGGNASFSVTATGTSLAYQWQLSIDGGVTWNNQANGGVYSNMTTATMNITSVVSGMNGYQYRCIVSGICSPNATSNPGILTMPSQIAYTTPGTYSWTCPVGVTSVSVMAIGGGGGSGTLGVNGGGGGGGGLGYKNNITVIPGNTYSVVVGAKGLTGNPGTNGGNSSFNGSLFANGGSGAKLGTGPLLNSGGTYSGADGGGNGGCGGSMGNGGGGGGAGGYSGVGGNGYDASASMSAATNGSGGSGAGGGSSLGGGGTGIYGVGANGVAPSGGGSGGANGGANARGGVYGGGAGYYGDATCYGSEGAVRIIWPGTTRQFPSTGTADQ